MEGLKRCYPYLFEENENFPTVLGASFMPLKLMLCNGQFSVAFNEAFIATRAYQGPTSTFRKAVTDIYVFSGVIYDLLSYTKLLSKDARKVNAIKCLEQFLTSKEHIDCLEKMNRDTEKLSESALQTILAVHLFGPLMHNSSVRLDATSYKGQADANCKYCHVKATTENTSFGNSDVWHGFGDILIDHSVVKIETESEKEEAESKPEQYSCNTWNNSLTMEEAHHYLTHHYDESDSDEPSPKKMKTDSSDAYMPEGPAKIPVKDSDVKKANKTLSQVLSQTIVNAFLQIRKNPELKGYFIPSLLASDKHVTIHMYNPVDDILLTQEEAMPLFTTKSSLNTQTILSVWMALNMLSFSMYIPGEADNAEFFEKSDFHTLVGPEVLSVYKNRLQMPLIKSNDSEYSYMSNIAKSYNSVRKKVESLNLKTNF